MTIVPKAITGVVEKSLEEYKENEKDFLVTKIEFKEATAELRKEMANLRAELIKWMFIFWVGQVGVITGILFAFFK